MMYAKYIDYYSLYFGYLRDNFGESSDAQIKTIYIRMVFFFGVGLIVKFKLASQLKL